MAGKGMKLIVSLAFVICSLYISGCNGENNQESGFLEGKISIGPICPVETVPPGPECLPTADTYKAYPVSIWTADGEKKIADISPALNGSYSIELRQGNYLIRLEKEQNSIGSSNLPIDVSIIPQEATVLNIDIDTGIR
jgi:hypothetical protein